MLKLASNSEFRESMKHVGEELQKAGVDMQSKVGSLSVFRGACRAHRRPQELMQEMTELMTLKESTKST
jgi:hypothetical protein